LDSEIFDEDHPIHLLPAGIANTIQQQQQSVENNPKSNIQYTAENPLFTPISNNNNESNTNRISASNNLNNNIMTPVNITNRSSTPNNNSGGSYVPPPHRSSGASGGGGSSLGDRNNSLGSARDSGGERGYSLDSDTSQSPRVGIWEYMFGKELRF
jgi:hypothetical protein